MKKPSAGTAVEEALRWAKEAEENDDDGDEEKKQEGEEEVGKDTRPVTKEQAWNFVNAMSLPPGSMGALPQEIHTLWNSIAHGPGTIPQRHALRNAIVSRSANYGHVCKIDPGGPLMKR